MEAIHADLPAKSFEQPDNIVSMTVCDQSGELPVDDLCDNDPRGSRIITEYFAIDNKPVDTCQTHIKIKMCDISEEPANVYCNNFTTKIYIKKSSVNIKTDNTASNSSNKDKVNMIPKDSEYALTDEQINKICSLHSLNNPGGSSSTQKPTESSGQQGNLNNSSDSNNNSVNSSGNNNSGTNNSNGNSSNNASFNNGSNSTESSTAASNRR